MDRSQKLIMNRRKFREGICSVITVLLVSSIYAQIPSNDSSYRWVMAPDGTNIWMVDDSVAHMDHIEMSGEKISAIIQYGVDGKNRFVSNRTVVWPMLRTIPNNTHASFTRKFSVDITDSITINDKPLKGEKVIRVKLKGLIDVESEFDGKIHINRTLFPSTTLPVYVERYTLLNNSNKKVAVNIPRITVHEKSDPKKGVTGSYSVKVLSHGHGTHQVGPGQKIEFDLVFSAVEENNERQEKQIVALQSEAEEKKRNAVVNTWMNNLVMQTPDSVLNRMFAFSKIRFAESIFRTKGGLMHGPGGGAYYAAIWANDQAEYAAPLFPFLGYTQGNEASLNAFRHFARFMNNEYKPIPSSIIAEGVDIWNGAGDRGDAAMIAYGATRFAMESGNKAWAAELWPLVQWCLEYTRRKLNSDGVPESDKDELEGRFPAGKANLSTACLYYDALRSAVMLGKALSKSTDSLKIYASQALQLNAAIEKYFGRMVSGFDTYQYYEGNKHLRSWICVPLAMEIYNRKDATIDALFSSGLWTTDGLATLEGDTTFWDRSTLYAFRGILQAGETARVLPYLKLYSRRRLLGDHVPYAVEAYPEGNQRHLSAESGLYCRIFTEGLFGIRPVSLNGFECSPQLPDDWNEMSLKKIHLFGRVFDLLVKRKSKEKVVVTVINGSDRIENETVPGKKILINIE